MKKSVYGIIATFFLFVLLVIWAQSSRAGYVYGQSVPAMPDYVIFKKPLFNFVLPDTVYNPDEVIDTISMFASPKEFEAGTFVIRANKDLQHLTIKVSDLVNGPNIIPKENIDIRVVKVWKQAGLDTTIEYPEGILVPELLIYNDADVLEGGFINQSTYIAPNISLDLDTNIPKNTSKQFWITVEIPENTPGGDYASTLEITSASSEPKTIKLNLKVLSIRLKEPKQTYLLYFWPYSGSGDNSIPNAMKMTDEILEKEMKDIKNHGFKGFYLHILSEDELRKVLTLAKKLGFNEQISVSYIGFQANMPVLVEYGYEPYIYGIVEPQLLDQEQIYHSLRHYIRVSYDIHQAGGKVETSIWLAWAEALDDPTHYVYSQIDPETGKTFRELGITNEGVDHASYHATLKDQKLIGRDRYLWYYIDGLRDGSMQKRDRKETYYWEAWIDKPKLNRMQAGYWLWTTKLDGTMPFIYQSPIGYDWGRDPFNDFDAQWYNKEIREMMLTYPSAQGPIITTKWEAIREGYDDIRYLTTLFDLLDLLQSQDPTLANQIRDEVNQELTKYYTIEDYEILSGEDFQNTRWLIIQKIIQVQNLLSPPLTPTPTPIPGDVDGNGQVNGLDVIMLISYLDSPAGCSRCDVDRNGSVNGLDVIALIGYL